jgi:hypothetical protein
MDRNGDIPLAVRIILAGPSPAHHILYSEPEKWVAEIRSAATDLGDVWIEKVKFATRHLQDLKPMLERDDPLARLVRSIDDIEGRPEAVAEFLGIFDDLKRKLPVEFRDGDQLRAFSDPERRRQIAADIRHALLPRLLELPEAR